VTVLDRALDRRTLLALGLGGAALAVREHLAARRARASAAPPRDARERHLGALTQLTFGGQNAEAYFDRSGEHLVFQSTRPPFGCDQIFTMRADGSQARLVSTGKGRTTCAYFFPDGQRLLYASTHLAAPDCPPPPDRSRGYVWPLHDYDLFTCAADGSDLRRIAAHAGYDAEGSVAPDGRRILFTSHRDGDLDLYLCDPDGGNVTRLTDRPGYDGGPFFSWDGRQIVWRGWHPTGAELAEYRELLGRGLVRPHRAELFLAQADGSGARQVTRYGAASWAPFLHPDGERIVFSSNLHDPGRFDFALYLVRRDGTGLERLTHAESFAAFPMFSRDGSRLVFCSSRGAAAPREYNVFVADWVD
jgi:TolB protein